MNEHTGMDLKNKGQYLRTKHALTDIVLAGILALAILFIFAYLFNRISHWAVWLLIIAFALLGLSACCGCTALRKTSHSLREDNHWPAESAVSRWFSWQGSFLSIAWLVLIAALIVSVYVRPGIHRGSIVQPQRPLIQQRLREPVRPLPERLGQPGERREQPPAAPAPPPPGGQRPAPPPVPPEGG